MPFYSVKLLAHLSELYRGIKLASLFKPVVYVLRGMRVRVDIFCLQIVHVIHHSKDDIELRHLV